MDWNAYEKQTGQQRPPWIDGVGNINYSWGARNDAAPRDGDKMRALANMPQVAPAGLRQGLMPAVQFDMAPSPWRPTGPGMAWVQAGQQLRPQGS
jgi:hypothetical protein